MLLPFGPKGGHHVAYFRCDHLRKAAARCGRRKVSRDHDSEKPPPKEPFINLSSTAAFVRRLFALKAVIAAIKFSNIHIDQLPPEQKVGGSNPLGRTRF